MEWDLPTSKISIAHVVVHKEMKCNVELDDMSSGIMRTNQLS